VISKGKLKRLKELAEHKMAIAETSVQGPIRLAHIEPKDLLELVDAAEMYRRHLYEVSLAKRRLRTSLMPKE
jgi:hypothetical protein